MSKMSFNNTKVYKKMQAKSYILYQPHFKKLTFLLKEKIKMVLCAKTLDF